ncbi:MAG: family 43 glycosylhydrolase [Planctomycetaceae bacterium]|nr:family 43 glycosylhydrolase [Planctomycetaceae bacterium]
MQQPLSGNPILPGRGVCDPHIRIYDDTAYLYATHDKSPDNHAFVMDDWWIWSSRDLVNWVHESSVRPQDTYYGKPDASCWAVDAIARGGKHYFYFSRGPHEIGVMEADTPVGPWRDPLKKPLIAQGQYAQDSRDPGLCLDDDGHAYIVFGTFEFLIARLNDDMISLAEEPRVLQINNPEGPYGKGKTDDKPYIHKRAGVYYLSWGCYYGMSDSIYGPYDCRGSFIQAQNVAPALQYKNGDITYDRHGSFFEWRKQWYFICNDMSRINNPCFRDSALCYVSYRPNGEIEPVRIEEEGVRLPE